MPITGDVVAISELNYSDSRDEAEADIFIQVPPNEPAGIRSSTVVFSSSLAE